jgi:hypothetical protein
MFAAAILAIIVGAVHSVLGEVLIFRHLRTQGLVPTSAAPPLRERHIRILWASWHVLTVFGWAFAAMLLWFAYPSQPQATHAFFEQTVIVAFLAGAFLVLIATKGRHPGWVGLSLVAVLTWFAARAA